MDDFCDYYNTICCRYRSALSEMAVHTFCKGAVMILGKPDNNQSQVSPQSVCQLLIDTYSYIHNSSAPH